MKNVLLVCMGQSPFNRSIWTGLEKGFRNQGCEVTVIDARHLEKPDADHRPDLLFSVHGGNTPVEIIDQYRQAGVTTAVMLLDEPYEVDSSLNWSRHYDWVFTVDRSTVDVHAEFTNAVHLSSGYDETVFNCKGDRIESEILMLGSCFARREELLGPCVSQFGHLITWVGPGWNRLYNKGRFRDGLVTPEECAMFYRGARITLNIHRDSTWSHFGELNHRGIEATHLNPRYWEAAACGSLPLSSFRSDINRYAKGLISFRDGNELCQVLEKLLGNPKLLKKHTKLAARSVKSHNYTDKAGTILETVNKR